MTGPPAVVDFVGRQRARDVLADAVRAARGGSPTVVSVEGAAGLGKTTLVRRVVASLGPDVTLVEVVADELAVEDPLGVVRALVGAPVDGGPAQASRALLERWAELADGPLVVITIDDLQWVDLWSRQALAAAARRLQHERLLLVTTCRPDHLGIDDGWQRLRGDARRCRRVLLDPLAVPDVAALAAAHGTDLGAQASQRLHAHTGGNPLYVAMLMAELPLATLQGEELPAPRTLAATTAARLAELPADAAALAEALSVLSRPTPLAVVATVADVDEPAAPLDALVATGFVEWRRTEPLGPIAFRHPLLRAAVYEHLPPSRRRILHASAADVSDRTAALVHRVAAAERTDDRLAAELEAAARDEAVPITSMRLWRWSAELTLERVQRDRRLLSAALLPLRRDEPSLIRELRPQLEACGPGALRDLVLGQLAWLDGDVGAAERMLLAAAASGDADVAGEALVRLAGHRNARGRGDDALDVAERALERRLVTGELERQAWAYRVVAIAHRDGATAGLSALRARLRQPARAVDADDAMLLATRGMLDYFAGRNHAAVEDLDEVTHRLRGATPRLLRRSHVHLAQALTLVGRWDDALVHSRAVIDVADEEHRLEVAQAHAVAAGVNAARGRWSDAEDHVRRAGAAAAAAGTGEAVFAGRVAEAAMHRARGDFGAVVAVLGPLSRNWPDRTMFSSEWWFPLIVALQNTGDLDGAARQTDAFEAFAARRELDVTMRVTGLRASQAARRGESEHALELFERSVGCIGPDDPALDVSSIHHAYGRLLRSLGRRQQAVAQLRSAHARFDGLEAGPYLDRVDEALSAIGLSAPRREHRSRLDLTDREQDVVTLVLRGMTNREVAADLYVSTKAVEYHLRNVFGKLGITSRRQLGAAFAPTG